MKKKKFLLGLATVLGLSASFAFAESASAADMHRLYNPNSGEHFYTANSGEKNHLVKVGWKSEGIGWTAPSSGNPVYRLYNKNAGDHHYTLNASEKNHLVKVGWKYEGIGWYSDTKKTVPLYRAYNPNAKAGSHNYTTNYAEQKNLLRVGWRNEGIAWYGVKKSTSTPTPVTKYTIKIEHKGSDGKVLKSSSASVEKGKKYTANSSSFNGYTLKGNKSQTITVSKNQTITFNYTKNATPAPQKYNVIVKHEDYYGKLLEQEKTIQVVKDTTHVAKAKSFKDYVLDTDYTSTQSVKITKDTTITFRYKKVQTGVNKSALISYYNDLIKNTILADYTQDSISRFNQNTSAIKLYTIDSNTATQADVDKALNTLKTIKSQMVSIKDLKTKVEAVKNLQKGNYTDTTWNAFNTARTEAQNILAKYNATQAQVNNALTKLNNAHAALKTNPTPTINKTALQQAIAKAPTSQGNYTQASWQAMQTALTNAKNINSKSNATQAEVDQAANALNYAISNLKTVSITDVQNKVNAEAIQIWRQYRAEKSKTTCYENSILQSMTNLRAKELVEIYDASHTRPNGYDIFGYNEKTGQWGESLAEEFGYYNVEGMGVKRTVVGENIAKIEGVSLEWIQEHGATYVMEAWKASPAHNNMLLVSSANNPINQYGIGSHITKNSDGTYNVFYVALVGYDKNLK